MNENKDSAIQKIKWVPTMCQSKIANHSSKYLNDTYNIVENLFTNT